jgi:hypothetical protein
MFTPCGFVYLVRPRICKKYVSAYDISVIHTGLGDRDRAIEWLNKAFTEHSGFMVYVYLDPRT